MKRKPYVLMTWALITTLSLTKVPAQNKATYYAAQIAVGKDQTLQGEWVTIVEVTNLTSQLMEASWSYFESTGSGRILLVQHSIDGEAPIGEVGSFSVILSGKRSMYLEAKDPGAVKTGWTRFLVDVDSAGTPQLGITVIYQFRDLAGKVRSSVGVPLSQTITDATLQVRMSNQTSVGIALANPEVPTGSNPNPKVANIEFWLYDNSSPAKLLERASLFLKPGEQMARLVNELVKSRPSNPNSPLSLEIHADSPIILTAIRLDDGLLSGVPVLQGRAR